MAIPDGYKTNFETLRRAFDNGDVALVETRIKATDQKVYVICMVERYADGSMGVVPAAKMFDGNPYEELTEPIEDMERDHAMKQ